MDDKKPQELENKMATIVRLLSLQVIQGKEHGEQIELLSKAGIPQKEIAQLTGKTVNNVKVTLHRIRKTKRRKKNAAQEKRN